MVPSLCSMCSSDEDERGNWVEIKHWYFCAIYSQLIYTFAGRSSYACSIYHSISSTYKRFVHGPYCERQLDIYELIANLKKCTCGGLYICTYVFLLGTSYVQATLLDINNIIAGPCATYNSWTIHALHCILPQSVPLATLYTWTIHCTVCCHIWPPSLPWTIHSITWSEMSFFCTNERSCSNWII